ncbi:MAG: hypothetical protein A2600_00280 [Candidatus Lambdaproteobacteria bacterium RIFOXYD1_FULL_56_27]|uniref:Uncharacterized protein n=1 Tax=Candidatus Lambdaproteobacteria bacterium RIFOXYD2_FULL_56_26 TaxID=1817773 RepID=A0A1F6GPS9_9PROT|nr:MAG: hypothetical protein A2557_04400 [Candidatus Lambdaproteobacteria bacterium RIFOXYD2_FULL_56_26]OGH03953.1 MAG: hypothetical protein A2426_07625 [Candidatus Lambdaproteobacteria bacterium RIFOXYC1_FULL_56_13]OGH06210.1 MAG: hypothetical protein A2600_00280 [Candidatus Lambdaproteobacteria bacterium RIFOXYD1_FULL_56_27]
MERDISRVRDTLSQMLQLSLFTERTYRMTVRDLGSFHLNWTQTRTQGESDVLWEYEEGKPVRITAFNLEEAIDTYCQKLSEEAIWPQGPSPKANAKATHIA